MYLLVAKVASLMVLHVTLGSETLSTTLRARERSLVSVDAHVDPQVLLL